MKLTREEDREGVGHPCSSAGRRSGPATSPNEHHRESVGECVCGCIQVCMKGCVFVCLCVQMSVFLSAQVSICVRDACVKVYP